MCEVSFTLFLLNPYVIVYLRESIRGLHARIYRRLFEHLSLSRVCFHQGTRRKARSYVRIITGCSPVVLWEWHVQNILGLSRNSLQLTRFLIYPI